MTIPPENLDLPTDLEALIEVAQDAAASEQLAPGGYYAFRVGDRVHEIDLTGDCWRDLPRRKTGTAVVRDTDSFLAYWAKHSDADSEVYADRAALAVTAVLDADTPDQARWGGHRLKLALRHSEAYLAWAGASNRPMTQVGFAEFLEDRRAEITSPPAADLLELAQSFQATTKVTFRSGTRLKSGLRNLSWVEEQTAGGGTGDLTIPDSFELALPVFEGAVVADRVTARLRYRINDGKLAMYFILDQLSTVVDSAFEGVVAEVADGVAPPVLRGTPG